jgi:hypothetical protein
MTLAFVIVLYWMWEVTRTTCKIVYRGGLRNTEESSELLTYRYLYENKHEKRIVIG